MAESGQVIMIDGYPKCDCSILGGIIGIGLCYDIQMMRTGFIKQDLDEDVDWENANDTCPTCSFNQLTG